MKRFIIGTCLILAINLVACNQQNQSSQMEQKTAINKEKKYENMNSYTSLFEIPATDITRAINFYSTVLEINIEKFDMPGMEMGVFPLEDQMITGIITKGEGYTPSENGVTVYLNGGNNLQIILDKVEKNGGKIIVPKTPHADENGFFALFLDSEGNKMGLNSPN